MCVTDLSFLCSQVLVVRQDLKMRTGKIASQCARKCPLRCVWSLKTDVFGVSPKREVTFFLIFSDAATGMYAELMKRWSLVCSEWFAWSIIYHSKSYVFIHDSFSDRYRLRQWEECGQPKIAVTCKNQQEM